MKIVDFVDGVLGYVESSIWMLTPRDLELLKDDIMETDEFSDVLVFNVINERNDDIKVTLMDPAVDKFNKVVNIYRMYTSPSVGGKNVLMVECEDNTVIREDV